MLLTLNGHSVENRIDFAIIQLAFKGLSQKRMPENLQFKAVKRKANITQKLAYANSQKREH